MREPFGATPCDPTFVTGLHTASLALARLDQRKSQRQRICEIAEQVGALTVRR